MNIIIALIELKIAKEYVKSTNEHILFAAFIYFRNIFRDICNTYYIYPSPETALWSWTALSIKRRINFKNAL